MRVKSLLLALGLSLVVGKSFAISFKVDGISYVANADTAIIKGYSEIPENGELTLASTVSYGGKDYRVTTVQGSAFLSCTDIKKLIVPANIKYIQSGAFENCVNMNKLVLAEGEDRLDAESDAFKNCGIEEVTIGRNLKASIFVRNAILAKVLFGSNIKNIPDDAFYGCSNLSSVDLSNVESIGNGAFASTKLENVEIPAQLSYLGTSVFSDCTSLTRVSIKANITSIPNGCFYGCTNLESIYFKGKCPYGISDVKISKTYILYVPAEYLQDYKDALGADYKYIYTWNPNESGDDDKPVTQCATPSVFYGAGKLKFSCETAGAKYHYTISDKDMATDALSEDGNVSLSAAYDISVYATADGYKTSEKAKATLYWVNANLENATNINQARTRGVVASAHDGIVSISGLDNGEVVKFYAADGKLIGSSSAVDGTASCAVSETMVIAKFGDNAIKVAVK